MTNPDPHSSPETAVPKLALVSKPAHLPAHQPSHQPSQVLHGHPSEAPADVSLTDVSLTDVSLTNVAAAEVPAVEAPAADTLTVAMDRLSLTQALLDVEVANARVLDLTARLVEANQRVDALRIDLDSSRNEAARVRAQADADVAVMRAEMATHQAYLDEQRSSAAFRWAAKVWNLRNALRS